MPGRSFRIARIAGIPVGVHPLWLGIVALITWSLGAGYFPHEIRGIAPVASYALGFASALLLFASILAHEFGHALVARRRGVQVEGIDLWLLGGVARMSSSPRNPGDELRYAAAGPAVTALIGVSFALVAALLPGSSPAALRALVGYQAEINGLIFVFNLLPAFPLDGGRILRALIWRRTGDLGRATSIAAALGRGFGYALVALGALAALNGAPGGLWFAVIGFFLATAAGAERMHQQVGAALGNLPASELMSAPVTTVPAQVTVAEAGRYFAEFRYGAFPVVDAAAKVVGVLTIDQVSRHAAAERSRLLVADVAHSDPSLLIAATDEVAPLLERPAFARAGHAVVVDAAGRAHGMVSITDVRRALRAARVTGSQEQPVLSSH